MKYFHVLILFGAVLCMASSAWAQYGLYGSPEILRLPQTASQSVPRYVYPSVLQNSVDPARPEQSGIAPAGSVPTATAFRLFEPAHAGPGQLVYAPKGKPKAAPPLDQRPRLDPPQPRGPRVVEQLLDETESYSSTLGCGADCGAGCGTGCGFGVFGRAVCQPDPCGCGPPACGQSLWYAYGAWLIMGRNEPNRLWTTYETNNNPNQLTNNNDIHLNWSSGGEIRIGRLFCCGCWTLEGTFWGLDTMTGQVSTTHASSVSTPLSFLDVAYANPAIPGTPSELFDAADEHRLSRRNEFYNIELNVIRNSMGSACGGCVDMDWSVGIRYFRFDENLNFVSLRGGGSWANPADIGHLEDRITNSLIGFQFGFDIDYYWRSDVRLFVTPKIGIYNNHINNRFRAYRGDGELFAPDPASGVPGSYPVNSHTNALSFLTQIDLGVDWQFHSRWSAFAGYRVMVATGIGLADNQFPPYVVDIPEIADIDYNGELVLHGAFAGVTYTF